MKTFLLAFVLFASTSAFAYTPKFEVIHDEADNTITLATVNDIDQVLDCTYSISWFENTLTFRRNYGKFTIVPGEFSIIVYDNDKYARLTRIKANVRCDD